MSILFQCNRFVVYEPASDSEAVALDNMQPDKIIYYLQFYHALFQSVNWRERMIMICSDEPLELNPPRVPYKKCLAEVIKNEDEPYFVSEEEMECIKALPSGWALNNLKDFAGYRSQPLPKINCDMKRVAMVSRRAAGN